MNLNYNKVPNIISCKDLDYLSDIYSWNYDAYKEIYNSIKNIEDEEIRNVSQKAIDLFLNNMNTVLEILEGGNINEQ